MASEDTHDTYAVSIHHSVADIGAAAWNRLLAPTDLPFLEWEWYAALELSGSISAGSGWQGVHIAVWRNDRLVGVAPLYLKMHSWGELAFDHGWQHIARQLNAEYFPKLVGMVPATPCSGYRFLIDRTERWQIIQAIILRAIDEMVEKWGVKTIAFNFIDSSMRDRFADSGYYVWSHPGFSWENRSFSCFEDYQQQFTKNQRRNIRRERSALPNAHLRSEVIPACDLPAAYFEIMHRYYYATNEKFGVFAAHFLNDQFFVNVAQRYAHRVLFSCCFRDRELSLPYRMRTPLAMAMLVHKNDRLYGRYWGGEEGQQSRQGMAHFNVCYYAPIEWAIDHRYSFFDPGIGGEHKLRRGFVADERQTLLRFTDPALQTILMRHHQQINHTTSDHVSEMNTTLPIKHNKDT